MGAPLVPHLQFPMSITADNTGVIGAVVNQQDSIEDVMASVFLIASCPRGAWVDQPAYGVPSLPFSQVPIDTTTYANAIAGCEPRAIVTAQSYVDLLDPAAAFLQVDVSTSQPDQ